jgi:integrase
VPHRTKLFAVREIRRHSRPSGRIRQLLISIRPPREIGWLRGSEICRKRDLVDPITVLMATGLRRSELLGLRWSDFDAQAGTVSVTGKVVRLKGTGLQRVGEAKSDAGVRTIPLPSFAVAVLTERRNTPYLGEQAVIFPSSAATPRDPDNFNRQWREARDELGVPDVTSHSFRKTVATLVDDEGLSARIGADHLGHANVSMTQDKYMSRGQLRRRSCRPNPNPRCRARPHPRGARV